MNKLKKHKITLVIAAISVSSFFSYSFVDNYFEISKNLDIFATLFRELNIYYVDETNPGELIKKGIDEMLESLDPYTNYIPESDIEDYRFMTTGEYGGIGAAIHQKGDFVVVSEPYEGFAAQKSDLRAGDIILEINGKTTKGKNSTDISKILKGQANTTVVLLIKREGEKENISKTITREEIKIKDVQYFGMLNEETGYIKLHSFTETASKEFKDAYTSLKEKNNMKSLVFDLRGNGGGLLRESVNIVNYFVEKGQDIVTTKGRVKDWDKVHKALNAPMDLEIPLLVLTDKGSASASEIVSGALQDLDRAVIIGQRTFGKGLVQQTRPISYNAQVKITVAKYYTPSGRCIQKLDYSHKNSDGVAEKIADSLITAFKSKNGRKVFDGNGILPDIEIEERNLSNISTSLYSKDLIFDYATKYRREHLAILPAKEFKLTDAEYEDFVKFLADKDYNEYITQTEKTITELKTIAEKEKYYDGFATEYENIKAKIKANKKDDLNKFKEEIKELLTREIAARYYYQKGRIEVGLSYDAEIKKALDVLRDKSLYASILDGTKKVEKK